MKSAFRLWKLHQNAPQKHSSSSKQAPQAPLGSQHQSSAVEPTEQRFRSDSLQASTTSGKEGCPHSFELQYWKRAHRWPAYGFGTGKGCLPHSKHRYGVRKFGKQKMGTHCLCLLNKIPEFFYLQYFTRGYAWCSFQQNPVSY